jgi:predicted PurR-regulated permease PerM
METPRSARVPDLEERAKVQRYLLLGLATGAALVIGLLFWPFLPAIVTSAVLAALVWPVHRRILVRVRSSDLAALISSLAVVFLLVVPFAGLAMPLLRMVQTQFEPIAQGAGHLLTTDGRVAQWLIRAGDRVGLAPDQISAAAAEQMQQIGGFLLSRTVVLLTGIGGWLLQGGAALFTLYYLLRDGERLVRAVRWLVPLEPEQTDRIFRLALEATRATVLGSIVVAIAQGLIGGLAFWLLGVPGAALWGVAMGVLSLVPIVGPFLVWAPAALILLATGSVLKGLLLAAFGTLVISTVDNVLRSVFIGGRAHLHPLAVFFSLLGGVFLFGAAGMLLGPVLFVISLTVLEMGRLALLPVGEAVPDDTGSWLLGPGGSPYGDEP